ncbi:FxsA family protein [Zhongshania marina]|uniref:Biotin--acetyl-CoA-carboxylase ligase n=1 Tax=Zhongshania marina TaxID=2304603 RepID=A0A2S4HIR4_9GAMM|nr:FxsA family protein [Marortus luteolus]POP53873.1 biotin--acetyl-CoA-carboxylase ligase [Marortus luteolus]
MRFLFVMFIGLPILEMWLLIKVGTVIGAFPTIAMVATTAVIGAALLKQQGIDTLTRAQQRLNSGQVPATEILEGLMLAVGGALLLTPGFVTDAIGFVCLIAPLRRLLIAALIKRGVMQVQMNQFHGGDSPFGAANQEFGAGPSSQVHNASSEGKGGENVIIEGEYKKEE